MLLALMGVPGENVLYHLFPVKPRASARGSQLRQGRQMEMENKERGQEDLKRTERYGWREDRRQAETGGEKERRTGVTLEGVEKRGNQC